MTPTDHLTALRAVLDPNPAPVPAPGDRLAAVLALLVERPEPGLMFTERARHLRRHAGEVSFPGGIVEPQDPDLAATALREANEEIGLDPSLPQLVGALPPVHTFVSAILVTPFVGVVDDLPVVAPADGEIDRILTVPVRTLLRVEEERELHREGERVWMGWAYDIGDATVWGATGFMLHALLERIREAVPSWTRI